MKDIFSIAYLSLLYFNFVWSKEGKIQETRGWFVTSIAGEAAYLPCPLEPRTVGDQPKLVLWYKTFMKSPVLSYDGRLPHLLENLSEGNRILNLTTKSATLVLNPSAVQDEGVYECRVDYFQSPTHTSTTNLTIIETPTQVVVQDGKGRQPHNGILGPFLEGARGSFICSVTKGLPPANVTWSKEGEVIDVTTEEVGRYGVKNTLSIPKLTRSWSNATLTCSASNTDMLPPLVQTFRVWMHLLPLSVEIIAAPATLEGQLLRLRCSSRGSEPPATLTWHVNGERKAAEKENTQYGQVTTSTIVLEAKRELDGAKVTCTAVNREEQQLFITNFTTISVHYPPSISASLGWSLVKTPLKEGDDVYFSCKVTSNPPVEVIQWFHEDKLQIQNVSQGIILTGDSLVLQRVNRSKVGKYRCRASNPLATKDSNWVSLKLRYKPECETPPTTFFLYDQPINVTCTVSSFPPVKTIQWRWNSSKETFDSEPVPLRGGSSPDPKHYDRSVSFFSVSPRSRYEERELSCYGINQLGIQELPCKFAIKVAKMPAPLSACRLANITASSLSLTCDQPTNSNVGPTSYRAEVYLENKTIFYNVTSPQPSFNVSRLDPATNYQIKVYVSRGPITSPPVVVSAYTSRSSRRKDESSQVYSSSRKGVLAGSLTTAFLFLLFLLTRFYYRRRKRRRCREQEQEHKHKNIDSKVSSEETNPDVVPNIEETYDLLSSISHKRENELFSIIKEPSTENFTMRALSHGEAYQPLTLLPSATTGRGNFEMSNLERLERSNLERGNLERTEDVYCPVDQLFKAEESVV